MAVIVQVDSAQFPAEMIVQTCENTLNGKRGFNNRLQYQIRFISLKVAFHNDL